MASMTLTDACSNILSQLTDLVHQIRESDFVRPAETLSYSTVGQHLRHTLEFFICFEHGFEKGLINYDKRAHDKLIETDKFVALNAIKRILKFVNNVDDKALKLEVGYDLERETFLTIDTTATRELVYNIEHAVHHMAIMKIGIREIAPYIQLPPDFGIAASTIRYKENSVASAH
jgi:uncharacterized damage-inducible protein DinB